MECRNFLLVWGTTVSYFLSNRFRDCVRDLIAFLTWVSRSSRCWMLMTDEMERQASPPRLYCITLSALFIPGYACNTSAPPRIADNSRYYIINLQINNVVRSGPRSCSAARRRASYSIRCQHRRRPHNTSRKRAGINKTRRGFSHCSNHEK